MTKPIGRLFWNGDNVSGYLVVGNYAIKFAAQTRSNGTTWIYQSKKQLEREAQLLQEVQDVKLESITDDVKNDDKVVDDAIVCSTFENCDC